MNNLKKEKMNKIKFLLGLIAALSGLFMVACTPYVLSGETGINPEIIDSEFDKIFYLLMMLGCGGIYCMFSVCLLKNWNLHEHKFLLYIGMISGFAFAFGLYYHMIFGSPC